MADVTGPISSTPGSSDASIEPYEARSIRWRWKDHWSGETGTYQSGSVSAWVRDCDGDFALFTLKRGDEVILDGQCDDFDEAIRIVEDKLVEMGWLAPTPYGVEACA